MSVVTEYLNTLKTHFTTEDIKSFNKVHGAAHYEIEKLRAKYPLCPDSLIELLSIVDGTYHRDYGDGEAVLIYMLGSDVYEYPYYLLSTQDMLNEAKSSPNSIFEIYMDGDNTKDDALEEFVEVDPRIDIHLPLKQHLCFSHCMNNGGTSRLYIDFNPAKEGNIGQIIRYLHDPDSYIVIADIFDAYLQDLIDNDFEFLTEEDE